MLSLFPELLFLAPFSALILRVAVGIAFAGVAWKMLQQTDALACVSLPVIGVPPKWLISFAAIAIGIIGSGLILGIATQLMALGGAAVTAIRIGLGERYDAVCPLVRSTQVFIMVICLSLLLTGAGPLAFDLPL